MAINVVYVHGIGEIGGAEKDLLSYLDLLDRTEFCPHVVCPDTGTLKSEVEKFHVPVVSSPLPPWRKLRHKIQHPWAVWKLANIFRQWNIDIVHVNDYWWAPLAYLAAKKCHIPVVVHIRQQIEPVRIKQYWLDKPDCLFPVSKDIENVLHAMAVEPSRVQVAYSGIDVNHFCGTEKRDAFRKHYCVKEDQPIIGTVANLFPRKGYEYLIEALVTVKEVYPDICYVIVGEGPTSYQEQLVRLVKEKRLESNVMFVGFQENVFEFLNAFDVFVLPSLMEGFGIALLEAMSMSKPIVACKVGGVPEVIKDGVTGMLVPPKDSKSLATALLKILKDDPTKIRLGLAARKIVETQFTREAAMKRIQHFYIDVLRERKKDVGANSVDASSYALK
ncbi:MAG: glycosyltransferase family 4 protein [Nitrospirae bacterium]|nr:glycosyltransferase family 4 protein [Nitrospirota bacterium]MDA1303641.1 glycosyltransferase family 4 protein [Nitrospirota bacterium]